MWINPLPFSVSLSVSVFVSDTNSIENSFNGSKPPAPLTYFWCAGTKSGIGCECNVCASLKNSFSVEITMNISFLGKRRRHLSDYES